jgi:hypothetical protein
VWLSSINISVNSLLGFGAVTSVVISLEIHYLIVTCSVVVFSGEFSNKFYSFAGVGHHHCQAVIICSELNILVCHHFSKFSSFKH